MLAVTSTQPQPAPSPPQVEVAEERNNLSICSELCAVEVGGNWDLSEAVVIRCGPTRVAVKAMVVVPSALALWAAHGNQILVIDTTGFQKLAT